MTRMRLFATSALVLAACQAQAPPPPASSAPIGIAQPSHVAASGAAPQGGGLSNRDSGNPAVAKAGAVLFTSMNCDGCHGGDGAGWVGPSLADGRWRYGGSDAEIFNSIYYGRPKGMPAFGGALSSQGVWALVTYLQSLPAPADVATESWESH